MNLNSIRSIVLDPKYHDLLAILKGFRNGIVYGAKVRFPHSLIMTFLFRSNDPLQDKIKFISEATLTHSKSLALFVVVFKSLLLLQRKIDGHEKKHHAFLAGLVGGYFVFGDDNSVNTQIILYLFSRVSVGLAKLAVKKGIITQPKKTFPYFAAVVWALAMLLFRHDRDVLQPSLQASMHYLYNLSDSWNGLRNFLWHNQ